MDAVANQNNRNQTGSTRIRRLVVATVASGAIVAVVVLSIVTDVLPHRASAPRSEEQPPRAESPIKPWVACALCGTIESIRVIEIFEEPAVTSGATDSRKGEKAGGATTETSVSVLDSLAAAVWGGDGEKNARKRHVYRVTLRMDDGTFRAISLPNPPVFAIGDKVRVVEGRLVRA